MLEGETINFQLGFWRIAASLALVTVVFFLYRRTYPSISLIRRITLATLRSLAFLAMLFLIFNPKLVSTKTEQKDPTIVILVDSSKSMGIEDMSGKSRLSVALNIAKRLTIQLRSRFKTDPIILPFSDHLLQSHPVTDSLFAASGEGTDIWGALFKAEERYKSENLKCIILISDGRVTRGMVRTGRGVSVPVFSIVVGDTLEGPDISIENVDYPRTVYTGESVKISAVVNGVGFKDSTITVRLMKANSVLDSKDLRFGSASQRKEVSLKLSAKKEGTYKLTVIAQPKPREKFEENNSESFRMEVFKSRIRILFIDEHLDWNTAFLRSLVKSSKRFKLSVVTWVPSTGYVSLPKRIPWSFPDEAGLLSSYDIVVISDEMVLLNKAENIESVRKYVKNGGKLLLLADEHCPILDAGIFSALEPILPIKKVGRVRVNVSEFYPAAGGDNSLGPLSSIFTEYYTNQRDIPPIPCILSGIGIRSSASVPLRFKNNLNNYPFLVLQSYGEGMSAVVLGFPLWRWKLAGDEGSNLYNGFFSSVIQYLTEDHNRSIVEVVSDRTVYRMGEVVGLKVFVHNDIFSGEVKGEIWKSNKGRLLLAKKFLFKPVTGEKGRFAESIRGLPEGDYKVVASISQGAGKMFRDEVGISVLPISVEFIKTSMDKNFLEYVSRLTGGDLINSRNVIGALKRCNMEKASYEIKEIRFLFNNIIILFIIIAIFSVEWTLRKLWGLV